MTNRSGYAGRPYRAEPDYLSGTPMGRTDGREKGSLAALSIHSDSEEILRSDVGFRASYQWQVGSVHVESFLKATREHEFKYSTLPITAGFADISGPSATFLGPSEGHDSAVVDAGISVSWTKSVSAPGAARERPGAGSQGIIPPVSPQDSIVSSFVGHLLRFSKICVIIFF
jgi:hypothetical protein